MVNASFLASGGTSSPGGALPKSAQHPDGLALVPPVRGTRGERDAGLPLGAYFF